MLSGVLDQCFVRLLDSFLEFDRLLAQEVSCPRCCFEFWIEGVDDIFLSNRIRKLGSKVRIRRKERDLYNLSSSNRLGLELVTKPAGVFLNLLRFPGQIEAANDSREQTTAFQYFRLGLEIQRVISGGIQYILVRNNVLLRLDLDLGRRPEYLRTSEGIKSGCRHYGNEHRQRQPLALEKNFP